MLHCRNKVAHFLTSKPRANVAARQYGRVWGAAFGAAPPRLVGVLPTDRSTFFNLIINVVPRLYRVYVPLALVLPGPLYLPHNSSTVMNYSSHHQSVISIGRCSCILYICPMRVLVACEFSGIVRDAFHQLGHDSWSCDVLSSETPGNHLQCNVLEVLDQGWDLMIAHPPCTHLAASGARWWREKRREQAEAVEFVLSLVRAPISRIAIENPRGILSSYIGLPHQVIHPWQFGHNHSKTTCLWLYGLPPLTPTSIINPGISVRRENQRADGQNILGESKDRWKIRSRTYPGIASAMAAQWGIPSRFTYPRTSKAGFF